jgi:hypothetical protein
MWFVVLLFSRKRERKRGFWEIYFLQGGYVNNKPTIANQDLVIQCLENDMSLFFLQIHHFLDLML